MANLLKCKPLDMLMREASETGEHSLKRALGPVNLITLGIGAIIGAGIFVLTGSAAAQYAGPAIVLSFILAGHGLCFCRPVLRRVCLADSHRRLGLHLRLRDPGRNFRLDHRLGPHPGVRLRRGDRGLRLERLRSSASCRTSASISRRSSRRRLTPMSAISGCSTCWCSIRAAGSC